MIVAVFLPGLIVIPIVAVMIAALYALDTIERHR